MYKECKFKWFLNNFRQATRKLSNYKMLFLPFPDMFVYSNKIVCTVNQVGLLEMRFLYLLENLTCIVLNRKRNRKLDNKNFPVSFPHCNPFIIKIV